MQDDSHDEQEPNNPSFASDVAAFSKVVEALQQLDDAGRTRLLRTVAIFFNIEAAQFLPARDSSRGTGSVSSSNSSPIASFSEDRTPTPKDFLRDKKPQTDVDRIACLAYYLTHYRNTPHFKTVDLSKLNTEAAQIKFSNPAYATDNAAKAGLLVPAAKGAKQLSSNGEEYVQALPDRLAAKEILANARPRRKKRPLGGAVTDSAESVE